MLMGGLAYECTSENCLKLVPEPSGCFPVPDSATCDDFGGKWTLQYAPPRFGTEVESADAGSTKACEDAAPQWFSLTLSFAGGGICVILGSDSPPENASRSGDCGTPASRLAVTERLNAGDAGETSYSFDLSFAGPGRAEGTVTWVLSAGAGCTGSTQVTAARQR